MDKLPIFERIEVVALGMIMPLSLSIYTCVQLSQGEAIFWTRSSPLIYQGHDAWLVSLFWFGFSGIMLGHFCLRPLRSLSQSSHKFIMWFSAALLFIGLASIWVLA